MKKNLVMGLLVIVTVFAFGMVVTAQDKPAEQPAKADAGKGTNQSEEKAAKVSPEAQAVADLNMAAALAEYGKREKNPMALLVAAQIMKNTPVTEEKRTKTEEGEAKEVSGKKAGAADTPDSLLTEAKKLAEGKEDILALIDKEGKIAAQRGASGGAKRYCDRVNPGRSDYYTVTFRGGEDAEIAVIGDGDCDLDLYVYDENGNFIGSDTDGTDRCYVNWSPAWTGPFRIKVENAGCNVYADYCLLTN